MTASAPAVIDSPTLRRSARRTITAILTHPVVMRVKRPLRDIWWQLKGQSIANPPIPRDVQTIVFICLGNICRSPFAALRASEHLARIGRGHVRCVSAGIRPSQAGRSPREACTAAAGYGISLDTHEPQPLTEQLMEACDLVVVMEAAQLQHLRSEFPAHRDRVVLLSLLDPDAAGAYQRYNIADPFGHSDDAYAECYRRIDRAVGALVRVVVQGC